MMQHTITNLALSELEGAIKLLAFDGQRGAGQQRPVPIKGDLTHPPLALWVVNTLGKLKDVIRASETAQQNLVIKYARENGIPDGTIIPGAIVNQLLAPALAESQELPELKPLKGEVLKKAGVRLDAGMIIALDFLLEGYDEALFEDPKPEEVKHAP